MEAFAVIREATRRTGMVALGRLVMSMRERICALEVEEEGVAHDDAAHGGGSPRH
jgi:DNA end-binding protein Ku